MAGVVIMARVHAVRSQAMLVAIGWTSRCSASSSMCRRPNHGTQRQQPTPRDGRGDCRLQGEPWVLKGKQIKPGSTARRTFHAGALAMPAAALGADRIEAAAATHIDHETGFILIQLLPSKRKGGAA
jgi:hypothetical protein